MTQSRLTSFFDTSSALGHATVGGSMGNRGTKEGVPFLIASSTLSGLDVVKSGSKLPSASPTRGSPGKEGWGWPCSQDPEFLRKPNGAWDGVWRVRCWEGMGNLYLALKGSFELMSAEWGDQPCTQAPHACHFLLLH